MHESRHNFTTDILQVTNVETARRLTAQRGEDLPTCARANEKRLRQAIRRFEGADINDKLKEIFDSVTKGDSTFEMFAENIKKMIDFPGRSG